MISHEIKCIFIEVPKTGSTSIRNIIGHPPKPHLDILQVKEQLPNQQFYDYFKFGFVRNPWDRTVSLYNRREGIQQKSKMSFKDFVHWIEYSSDTCIHPRQHKNQLDWFTDENGGIIIDFIGKFEELESDWEELCSILSIPIQELPHINQNPINNRHYSTYYDEESREIIAKKFWKDISYFSYSFENGHSIYDK